MKVLCISDTHNKHEQIPLKYLENLNNEIKMIIHAGDLTSRGSKTEVREFFDWYATLPFEYKIVIAGNHDFFFEQAPEYEIEAFLAEYPNIIYLNDTSVEIEGFKIHGSPITPYFNNWAFNRIGDAIKPHWDLIPNDTDILVVHGPVKGYLDVPKKNYENGGVGVGCPYLLEKMSELTNLSCFIHGHIHERYGAFKFANDVWYFNASLLNLQYVMVNKPFLLVFDDETKKIKKVE